MAQLGLSNQRVSLPDLAKAVIQAFERLGGLERGTSAKLVLTQDLNTAGRLSIDRLRFS